MLQIFVLTIALASIVFLSLQPNKDGRQDLAENNLNLRFQYLNDEVDMLKMSGTNSTLIESGVCQIYYQGDSYYDEIIPVGAFVNYSLFTNSVRDYVIFENVSNVPILSFYSTYYINTRCPFYNNYTQRTNFYIGGCTTDLTYTNFTVNRFNDLEWFQDLYGSILKSDQSKINPNGIFVGSGSQCNQNQVLFDSREYNYGFQNTGFIRLNIIGFAILSQNMSTDLSISGSIMLLLPSLQSQIK